MTLRTHEKHLLGLALSLTLVGLTSGFSPAQDGVGVIPEGSGSIIQPVSWQLTGENAADQTELAELAGQVRTAWLDRSFNNLRAQFWSKMKKIYSFFLFPRQSSPHCITSSLLLERLRVRKPRRGI